MSKVGQTSIEQVYCYIREHFQPGESISTPVLRELLPWLTVSSISSALYNLERGGWITFEGKLVRANIYKVTKTIFEKERKFKKSFPTGLTKNRPIGSGLGSKRRSAVNSSTPKTCNIRPELDKLKESLLQIALEIELLARKLEED
jgi:hypothetical protein